MRVIAADFIAFIRLQVFFSWSTAPKPPIDPRLWRLSLMQEDRTYMFAERPDESSCCYSAKEILID
jgi:hypothetical protein